MGFTRPRVFAEQLSSSGQFPPLMGRRLGNRVPVGLLITAAGAVALAVGFSLTAIASIGSAAALRIFFSSRLDISESVPKPVPSVSVLVLGALTTGLAFLTFVFTTLIGEPASAVTLVLLLLLSFGLHFRVETAPGRG